MIPGFPWGLDGFHFTAAPCVGAHDGFFTALVGDENDALAVIHEVEAAFTRTATSADGKANAVFHGNREELAAAGDNHAFSVGGEAVFGEVGSGIRVAIAREGAFAG